MAAVVAALAAPPVARADVVSATASGRVSAEDGVAAWSEPFKAPSGARSYRLVVQRGEHSPTSVRGLRSRKVPFDLDLGTDAHGQKVATYTRCRREPAFSREETRQPAWDLGRGCTVYELSLSSGGERPLRRVGARGEPYLPSRWGTRVAFGSREAGRPRLKVVDLRTGRTQALQGGTTGPPDTDLEELSDPGLLGLDLHDRTLVFSWAYLPADCDPDTGLSQQPFATEIWVERLGFSTRRLVTACSNTAQGNVSVGAPALVDGTVAYRATTETTTTTRRLRCVGVDGRADRDAGPAGPLTSLAVSDDRTLGLAIDATSRSLQILTRPAC